VSKWNKWGRMRLRHALATYQGGVCAICGIELTRDRRPCIDHDHVTKKVRGLICSKCNNNLGGAEWYIARKEIVDDYLSNPPADYLK
jgi:hypothetical protein